MSDTTPWVLKYSPKSVDDMVLTKSLADLFNGIVKTKRLSNLAIFGSPGIGKTTLAKIIVDSLGCDYWVQPCSADGSIDMVKTSVKNLPPPAARLPLLSVIVHFPSATDSS